MNAMAINGSATAAAMQRVIPEKADRMARADLRIPDVRTFTPKDLGECLDQARGVARWNLDQLAGALKRDPRQVARWLRGDERAQVDVVISVPELAEAFVVAMARIVGCEVETVVRVRRTA